MEQNSSHMIGDYFAYSVMADIVETFEKVNELKFDTSNEFNRILKTQIFFLSEKYNYRGYRKKDCITLEDIDKSHLIDIIWQGKYGKYIAAFEVSDNFISKPVTKLKEIDAVHKFWIYYGDEDIPLITKIINEFKIHVIRLHR